MNLHMAHTTVRSVVGLRKSPKQRSAGKFMFV